MQAGSPRRTAAFTGHLVGALVVDPGCAYRHRTGSGGHLTGGVVAVADDQPVAVLIELVSMGTYIGGDLGLHRRRSICRAPSRTISSSSDSPTAAGACALVSASSWTTLSMGDLPDPARQRRS